MSSENTYEKKSWFSNLFKCAAISLNTSSKGPLTIASFPRECFDETLLENLGVRAILSAGIGDNTYRDRIFSARITLPKMKNEEYEALIFNFVIYEDTEHISLKINTKSLALLVFIYPKSMRRHINRFELDLETLLKNSNLLPKNSSKLFDKEKLSNFITRLRKSIVSLETNVLLQNGGNLQDNDLGMDNLQVNSVTYLQGFS